MQWNYFINIQLLFYVVRRILAGAGYACFRKRWEERFVAWLSGTVCHSAEADLGAWPLLEEAGEKEYRSAPRLPGRRCACEVVAEALLLIDNPAVFYGEISPG
ncbi:MAG: hypothetical protein ACLVAW_25755 [Eisenbergiella massiliensis]